ncbi:MAG TPA: monovalent cation/H+ antiporter complex subunit F [Spirochaetota bacterium]|nr:monovalent cation/H+ antiporter complex subunit F [Spirochaetota bacterium]
MNFIILTSVITAGLLLCMMRLLKGPTAADRAVAVDTATTVSIAFLVLLGFIFNRYIYLDVALVYAVISFAGLITIARFMEKGI